MAERKRIGGKCFSLSGTVRTKAEAIKKSKRFTKEGQNVNVKKVTRYEVWVEC